MVLGHGLARNSASSSGQSVMEEENGNFQATVRAGWVSQAIQRCEKWLNFTGRGALGTFRGKTVTRPAVTWELHQ